MFRKFFLLLFLAFPAFALTVDEPLADGAQEARAKALFHEYRCVVCASESLAESPAEVAKEIRAFIRGEVASGKSDAQITDFLVARYGDVILMEPPLNAQTLALWALPFLMLGAGVLWMRKMFAIKPLK
jgi:cytochrome c-type biogenesis protein CcmH